MILLRLVAGSASFVVVSLPKLTVIACLLLLLMPMLSVPFNIDVLLLSRLRRSKKRKNKKRSLAPVASSATGVLP